MSSQQFPNLPNDVFETILNMSKYDLRFIDHIRPFYITYYNVDIFDIIFGNVLSSNNRSSNTVHSSTPLHFVIPEYRPNSFDSFLQ